MSIVPVGQGGGGTPAGMKPPQIGGLHLGTGHMTSWVEALHHACQWAYAQKYYTSSHGLLVYICDEREVSSKGLNIR